MRRWADRPLRGLQIAVLLIPFLSTAILGWLSWTSHREAAFALAARNAELVREYAFRIFQTQKILLDSTEQHLATVPAGAVGSDGVHRFLAGVEATQDNTFGLAVVAQNGDFVGSSRFHPPRGNVADRSYFQRIQAGEAVFLDRVRLSPNGEDALVVAQRRPGETFSGLLVSAIDVSPLREFMGQLASTESGAAASLFRADGVVLLRNSVDDPVALPPGAPLVVATARADRGFYEAVAVTDGVYRMYAFSRVGDLPLFGIFGVSRDAVIAEVARDIGPKAGFLFALSILALYTIAQIRGRYEADRARLAADFDRKLLEEARNRAELRETMMRELNHRVKNNLQSVLALIRIKSNREKNPFAEDVGQRVAAIADMHELLYRSDDQIHIDLKSFLARLCRNEGLFPPERNVRAVCDLEPVEIGFGQSTPVALIVVEIITNALKHAFPGRDGGTITVRLRQLDRTCVLEIADDGVGMPEEAGRMSGIRLIEGLAAQLGGTLHVESDGGTRYRLDFPIADTL